MSVSFITVDNKLRLCGGTLEDVRHRINLLECAVAQQWHALHQLSRYAELPKALTDYRTPEEIARLIQLTVEVSP